MRIYSLIVLLMFPGAMRSCTVTMPETLLAIAGKNSFNLNSKAIEAQGGYQDTLVIGDDPPGTPDGRHGSFMLHLITYTGVPEEHIRFFRGFGYSNVERGNLGLREFFSGNFESLRMKTRVVHQPVDIPFRSREDPLRITEADSILFVVAAGNMNEYYQGDRDLWRAEHINWDPAQWYGGPLAWQSMQGVIKTGKVIWATHAIRVSGTEVKPDPGVVSCGDLGPSCFATTGGLDKSWHTSGASARLSAKAFYLAQLHDTPEEIIEVLQECAIDVGELGADREYGSGVINLICPRILKRELEIVSGYVGEAEEEPEETRGGDLVGTWEASNGSLEVCIPQVLNKTVQLTYAGEVNGEIEFGENTVIADFKAEAAVQVVFLTTIEAKVEEVVQIEGTHTITMDTLCIQPNAEVPLMYAYTATEDSLHLVKSLSLKEALSLLPGLLGSMASTSTLHLLDLDPIQIKMSFAKKPKLVGDFDDNDVVDFADFLLFVETFGSVRGDRVFDERMDLEPNGVVNFADFLVFISNYGATAR